jgi:hypothetical protein
VRLSKTKVAAEMARRKVRFNPHREWDTIKLWGLFLWEDVSWWIQKGDLITDMKKENRTIWVRPSKKFWESCIKPMVDNHTLDKLTRLAGWNDE